MKVLFLTIGQIPSLKSGSVHIDVIKALKDAGHDVTVLCTMEKRLGKKTCYFNEDGVDILRLKIGNITRCSIIEKGISTILIETQFIRAIKKYFYNKQFDLVIYNTPPITLAKAVKYCKKKFNCKSYLMLKDIFPQNAVDIGILSKSGLKGILYKMFRYKEKQLYDYSDKIGCMSNQNMQYILDNNKTVSKDKVELFPNSVYKPIPVECIVKDKQILQKYNIPMDKLTFIYGGNLGLPQGLEFLVEGIKKCVDLDCNFVIVGSGAKKEYIFNELKNTPNAYTIDYLPHNDYYKLCCSADVGMIMLDYRFTIPNYPSRSLAYLENAMPIFACTDKTTDIKELVETDAKCGKWCYSNDLDAFKTNVEWFINNKDKLDVLGQNGRIYLEKNFDIEKNIYKIERMCPSTEE